MEDKTYYRTIAKTRRKELDIKETSSKLCAILRKSKDYIESKNVMIYYPLKYEVNVLELLNDNKQFYFPKVYSNDLLVCPYSNELVVSNFGVKEPCSNPVSADVLDLVIVPALMVDNENYRLGYGGGYYDRFLAKYPKLKSVTLIPKELCVRILPRERFDIPIDMIISG